MFPWSESGEPMRFDRFMQAALHDPEHGYYGQRIRGVGRDADFSTSASLSGALGRAIASWADQALARTHCRHLIELGPGSGELAETVLRALPWHRRFRTTLHLVESSAPLRAQQQERLGRRVQWHADIQSALEASQGHACLYSNEFVDAFPVRRFRKETDGWSEQFVNPGQSHWQPIDTQPSSSAFTPDHPPGQIVEVHESYHSWLDGWLADWRCGEMVTIDYGEPIDRLYHRRPEGSLRGYFHHQLIQGAELLERPGHQDLTTDVNFTDLIDWTSGSLETLSLKSQSDFLADHLRAADQTDHFLAHPGGAGCAFQSLHQHPHP